MSSTKSVDSSGGERDPFEEVNRAMGAGMIQNPYPDFVAKRRTPVARMDIRAEMGLEMSDDDVAALDVDIFTVSTFDTVQQVLRDNVTFSSAGYAEVMGQVLGHS